MRDIVVAAILAAAAFADVERAPNVGHGCINIAAINRPVPANWTVVDILHR